MNEGLPPDTRTDEALVEAANRGDIRAFEALYRRHRDWALRLAWRFTRHDEDALDVLQDTFRYLLGKFPGFRLSAGLRTFLYPVVKNLSLSVIRQRRRDRAADVVLDDLASPTLVPQASGELAAVLSGLPAEQREVLLMRFVDDLPLSAIADALNIPLGTVKSRLHNALAHLRDDARTRRYFAGE